MNKTYCTKEVGVAVQAALPSFESEMMWYDVAMPNTDKGHTWSLNTKGWKMAGIMEDVPALSLSDVLLAIEKLDENTKDTNNPAFPSLICKTCYEVNTHDPQCASRRPIAGSTYCQHHFLDLYLTHYDLSHEIVTEWLVDLFGNH